MPSGNTAVAREEVELSFKRYILEKTEDFEREPMADLYRVNLLGQMLDRYDALRDKGMNEERFAADAGRFRGYPQTDAPRGLRGAECADEQRTLGAADGGRSRCLCQAEQRLSAQGGDGRGTLQRMRRAADGVYRPDDDDQRFDGRRRRNAGAGRHVWHDRHGHLLPDDGETPQKSGEDSQWRGFRSARGCAKS